MPSKVETRTAPSACPGCGALFTPEDGPIHRYMISSPACWAAFGRIMAAEYSDPALMPVHRLSVDAFAVQHPGDGSRQATQSVGLHLARLHVQLERGLTPDQAHAFMLRAAENKVSLPALPTPELFNLTTADVGPLAGTSRHIEAVQAWAESAWRAHTASHAPIRRWATSFQ